jgi:hypothetical protein
VWSGTYFQGYIRGIIENRKTYWKEIMKGEGNQMARMRSDDGVLMKTVLVNVAWKKFYENVANEKWEKTKGYQWH